MQILMLVLVLSWRIGQSLIFSHDGLISWLIEAQPIFSPIFWLIDMQTFSSFGVYEQSTRAIITQLEIVINLMFLYFAIASNVAILITECLSSEHCLSGHNY